MHATFPLLKSTDFPANRRKVLDTLQVNLGYHHVPKEWYV